MIFQRLNQCALTLLTEDYHLEHDLFLHFCNCFIYIIASKIKRLPEGEVMYKEVGNHAQIEFDEFM
jgi:hypothetical protein